MKVMLFGLSDPATVFLTKHFNLRKKQKDNGLEVFQKHSFEAADKNYYPLFIYRRKGFRPIEEMLQKKLEDDKSSFYFCALRYENDNKLIAETVWNDEQIDLKIKELVAAAKQDSVDKEKEFRPE